MTRLLVLAALALSACQEPEAPVASADVTGDEITSVLITVAGDGVVQSATVRNAGSDVSSSLALVVDTTEEGQPYLWYHGTMIVRDTLDPTLSRSMQASIQAAVPESAVSFSRRTIAAGTYAVGGPTSSSVEVGWRRETATGSNGASLRTPLDPRPTGTLVVDSVRAGVAYGGFELESRAPRSSGHPGLVSTSGSFQAPLQWPAGGGRPPAAR